MHAVVQVPIFDEPTALLEQYLELIRDQDPPPAWSVDWEAWITPAGPDDPSFGIARSVGFETFTAPSGKLSARNAAHDRAADGGADAIISWDADAPPLRGDVLQGLLESLEEPGVVAVNSATGAIVNPDGGFSIVGAFVDAGSWIEDAIRPHMHGQCSVMTSEAWTLAGPFDESIDQTTGHVVRSEEEFGFYHRLEAIGDVVEEPQALVFNEPRRHFCHFAPQLAPDGYCDSRAGATTFNRRP